MALTALLDTGAEDNFISSALAEETRLDIEEAEAQDITSR